MQKIRHGVYANVDALASTMIDVERIVPRGVTQIQGAWCIAHQSWHSAIGEILFKMLDIMELYEIR